MLYLLHYPHELIAERVVFTPADLARIDRCRGSHNRLGFAYQMGFLHLTGRFPTQQPLEILDDLLAFVAHELAMDPAAIQDYAQRQATVSAHQEEIRFYLGFRPFDAAALSRFLSEEATRVEHMPALLGPGRGVSPRPPYPPAGPLHRAPPGRGAARASAPSGVCADDGVCPPRAAPAS